VVTSADVIGGDFRGCRPVTLAPLSTGMTTGAWMYGPNSRAGLHAASNSQKPTWQSWSLVRYLCDLNSERN
jgi:hypothetical protein